MRAKIRLLLHDFFLLRTHRRERRVRLAFVFYHACEQSAAERCIELRLVVAEFGVAQCSKRQSADPASRSAKAQKNHKSADTLYHFRLFGPDFVNGCMQRSRVSFPIEQNEAPRGLCLRIIRLNG